MKKIIDELKNDTNHFKLISLASDTEFFFDPDWTRFYFQEIFLESLENNNFINSIKIANIPVWHGSFDFSIDKKYIIVFLNFKTRSWTYAMNWCKYYIDIENLKVKKVEELFVDRNDWWFPIIENDNIIHFSFDWYFEYFNNEKKDFIEPAEFEKKCLEYKEKHIYN